MNEWHTVSQAAKKINIPAETVRRYVRTYGEFMRLKKGDKRAYIIHKNSLPLLEKIRYLLNEGNQQPQVEEVLRKTETLTVQVNDDEMNEYLLNLPQLHREIVKQMKDLKQQNEDLRIELNEVKAQIAATVDEGNRRDAELMRSIREIMDSKNNQGFWSKWFKK